MCWQIAIHALFTLKGQYPRFSPWCHKTFPYTTSMIYGILFVLWLAFWSFGAVIAHRLGEFTLNDIWDGKKEFRDALKSILVGRSHCEHCKHTLHGKDLVPVVSYIATKGKCRYCKKRLSLAYPLGEIWCGFVFLRVWSFVLGTDLQVTQMILWLAISWLLYLLMIFDVETNYLHELIWLLASILTVSLVATSDGFLRYYAVQRGVIFTLFFLAIYYIAKVYIRVRYRINGEWFGIWDVRLAPVIGMLFGLLQVIQTDSPSLLNGIILFQRYIVITGIIWLLYAGWKKLLLPKQSAREIPFFPGMVIALWILMLFVQ